MKRPANWLAHLLIVFAMLWLAGCSSVSRHKAPVVSPDASGAIPRDEKRSSAGNPSSYQVFGRRYYTLKSARGFVEEGIASWYGKKFHNRPTANGEIFDLNKITAAHTRLPLPSYVRVTNLENGKQLVVRVNDRGPFHENRIIDLSHAAAVKLGFADNGTALVEVRALNSKANDAPPSSTASGASKLPGDTVSSPPSLPPVSPESSRGTEIAKPEATRSAVSPALLDKRKGFFIQIASFQSQRNASDLRARLRSEEQIESLIREVGIAGDLFYRVFVGPTRNVAEADRLVRRLNLIGLFEYKIRLPSSMTRIDR